MYPLHTVGTQRTVALHTAITRLINIRVTACRTDIGPVFQPPRRVPLSPLHTLPAESIFGSTNPAASQILQLTCDRNDNPRKGNAWQSTACSVMMISGQSQDPARDRPPAPALLSFPRPFHLMIVPPKRTVIRRLVFIFILVLWLSVVSAGMAFVWSYNHTPGTTATAPARWPIDSRVPQIPGRDTLVVLAHPKCPCTRATVEELSKLMANCQGRLNVYVLFVEPKGSPADWHRTDLWNSAARIPGVNVLVDDDGIEANRFGAATSGQVLLYDEEGTLRFHGGITESRGHSGDNAGSQAIASLVNRGVADRDRTLVFGCPLFDPDSECRRPTHARITN